jgi:pimeloyl-ACP methyl ester carboxylesterase
MNTFGVSESGHQAAGDALPVVYLHGAFSSPSAWRGILKVVADGHPTIVPALPGLAAPLPPSLAADHGIENEVEHLAFVIEAETTGPVHLVGHSYGGLLAYAAAMTRRIDITGCTLFEPLTLDLLKRTGDSDALGELSGFLQTYGAAHEAGDPWAVRMMIDMWGGPGFLATLPEKVQLAMAAMTGLNIQQWKANFAFAPSLDEIRAVGVPVSLVHGEVTHPLCKLVNERLHGLLPNSRIIEVEGASHFLIQSHAEICAGIIIQDVEASSPETRYSPKP